MSSIKLSKDFYLTEFVPKEIYAQFGNKSRWFINQKMVDIAQFLRDVTGLPGTINNWFDNGQYNFSGYRPPDCTVGGELSQHKFCNAIDYKAHGITPPEVLEVIKKNYAKLRELGLTTVEDVSKTPTWNHLDCRNTGMDELLIVMP
jgi:hypothetical protein